MNRELVKQALTKPAPYGPDIDLFKYRIEEPDVTELREPETPIIEASKRVGLEPDNIAYIQSNERAMYTLLAKSLSKYGVVLMPTRIALEKFPKARELAWRLLDPTKDKYVAFSYLYGGETGYFIYVPPGVKVPIPIYTCLAITSNNVAQTVHNIVYVDDGAEVNLVTGCAIPHGVRDGIHIGLSEYYVGKGARLTFTMVHAWAEGLHVRPRTVVRVDEGGEYVSYYVTYSPVASIQTYPIVYQARNARSYLASIIAANGRGVYDIGSMSVLMEPGASSENISRVVARDESSVYARAEIEALESDTRGHIECLGLLLSPTAHISSIPIVTSRKHGAMLSHEAAIGLIAEKEIEYLKSRGFTEDEARSVLIRGFMNIDAPIPPVVKKQVENILDIVTKYAVG